MKYFSCFSGIGGFEVAIQSVFPDAECVGYSEINPYTLNVYQKHFPNHKNFGDITKINSNELPDFDLLVGGSPCQDLSIAKKDREGLDGKQSGLFWNIVEIIKVKKPKWIVIENVASMSKANRELISQELGKAMGVESLPYACLNKTSNTEWLPFAPMEYLPCIEINASLVSAQNRNRLFWANFLITQPEDRGIMLKDILEDNHTPITKYGIEQMKSNTIHWGGNGAGIDDRHNWNTIRLGQIGNGGQGERIYSIEGKSVSLSANGGGRGAKTGLYCVGIIPESIKPKGNYLPRERVFSDEGKFRAVSTVSSQQPYLLQTPRGNNKGGKKALDGKTPALTISAWEHNNKLINGEFIRKLTPIEVARLQCFEDDWCSKLSNTQQYRCYGNAVNVEVVKHIFKCFKGGANETTDGQRNCP